MSEKKVLIKTTDLKQYFPVDKKGLYVKANDGISMEIFQGETFGLVGESGCGKSTLGRVILQLYHQTDGKTMYYGWTLDEYSPSYVRNTLTKVEKLRQNARQLQHKADQAKKEFDALGGRDALEKTDSAGNKAIFDKYNAYRAARKKANDAFEDIVEIIGGFYKQEDLKPVAEIFLKKFAIAKENANLRERIAAVQLEIDEREYKQSHKHSNQAEALAQLREKIKTLEAQREANQGRLNEVEAEIEKMRAAYANDEEFQELEKKRETGIDLARLKYNEMRRLRSDMQMIFQDPYSSLNPKLTLGQIIGEGLIAHKFFKRNDDRLQEYVQQIMENCGLQAYFIHRYPHQFSGGQRQRIGIARSLAVKPKFVVCDEAVSALDVSIQSQIINLLQDLKEKENLTYLFISHDLSVVKYISDRIGVMYLGNLVELAETQELFGNAKHPYTEALLKAIPTTDVGVKKERELLEGDIPSPINPPKGCKFHTRCRYATEICRQVVPEWEQVGENHYVACHHQLGQE